MKVKEKRHENGWKLHREDGKFDDREASDDIRIITETNNYYRCSSLTLRSCSQLLPPVLKLSHASSAQLCNLQTSAALSFPCNVFMQQLRKLEPMHWSTGGCSPSKAAAVLVTATPKRVKRRMNLILDMISYVVEMNEGLFMSR